MGNDGENETRIIGHVQHMEGEILPHNVIHREQELLEHKSGEGLDHAAAAVLQETLQEGRHMEEAGRGSNERARGLKWKRK